MSDASQFDVFKEMAVMGKRWFGKWGPALAVLSMYFTAVAFWIVGGYYLGPYLQEVFGFNFQTQLGITALGMNVVGAIAFISYILIRWYLAAKMRVSEHE